LQGDVSKMQLIVTNLLTNATKFCAGATVSVSVQLEKDAASSASSPLRTLRVDVADRGPGLTEAQCVTIFRPYEHAASSQGGGAGIGLHLSREFARAMGGDLTVESTPGEGATCVPTALACMCRSCVCAPETHVHVACLRGI
jgi:signal transduction histidine kinase